MAGIVDVIILLCIFLFRQRQPKLKPKLYPALPPQYGCGNYSIHLNILRRAGTYTDTHPRARKDIHTHHMYANLAFVLLLKGKCLWWLIK